MPEGLRERVAGSVASGLRDAAAAGCDDDAVGGDLSDAERLSSVDARHRRACRDDHTRLGSRSQQRVEDRARAIGHREQLAGFLALQIDAERPEEIDRGGHVERTEDLTDRIAVPVEVFGMHNVVRDVASPAAGNQDLRADAFRAVERDDASALPRSEDRGHQAGRTGTHDCHIVVTVRHTDRVITTAASPSG